MLDPVNPKLKDAMAEIKPILERHDVGAIVVLCSGEQSEFLNYIFNDHGPSWSCLYPDKNGVRIRARGKRDHAERFKINSTIKMISTMKDVVAMQFQLFDGLLDKCREKFDIVEGKCAFEKHKD